MATKFDDLPLDGDVKLAGLEGTYVYRGHHAGNIDKCAVRLKGPPKAPTFWIARDQVTAA